MWTASEASEIYFLNTGVRCFACHVDSAGVATFLAPYGKEFGIEQHAEHSRGLVYVPRSIAIHESLEQATAGYMSRIASSKE